MGDIQVFKQDLGQADRLKATQGPVVDRHRPGALVDVLGPFEDDGLYALVSQDIGR